VRLARLRRLFPQRAEHGITLFRLFCTAMALLHRALVLTEYGGVDGLAHLGGGWEADVAVFALCVLTLRH
jgi:hypothetical protein